MNYGRYETDADAVLGKGAMGVVYRALDPKLNRRVAIKVLHKKLLYDDDAVQGFLKEAMLNAGLSHPKILTILDVGEEGGEVYIAMELLEGKPLSKMIGSLDRKEVISIGMQMADALDFAHKKGVVHRDIKPANIMVASDGQIKITDFGIAKGVGGGEDLLQTQTGVIKGTPVYMSPEQARGDSKHVDGRSDLFSLGVMLYEMSTGKRPFGGEGKDFMAVFGEILDKTPVEPCKVKETVDRDLSSVIMKALQKDPAKRFQSGAEFYQALKGCELTETTALPRKKSKPAVMIGAVCALVLALLGGGLFLFSTGQEKTTAKTTQGAGPKHVDPPVQKRHSSAPPKPETNKGEINTGSNTGSTGIIVPPPPPPPPSEYANLNVVSNPSGAKVYVNGSRKGVTPLRVLLRLGKYRVRLAKSGYKNVDTSVTLDKTTPPLSVTLPEQEPPTKKGTPTEQSTVYAFLKVASNPSGAQVYVDGSLKGMTPLKVRLGLGKYRVRLAKSGYKSVETSMTLDKMAEFPLTEELQAE